MKVIRLFVLIALFLVLLVPYGCGGTSDGRARMVVFRSASGPIYQELLKTYARQMYRPNQNFAKVSLFVIDGTTASAAEIEALDSIDDATKAGVPILFLNVNENHKRGATLASQKIGAYLKGDHDGYLVTPTARGIDILHLGHQKGQRKVKFSRLRPDGVLEGSHADSAYEFEPDANSVSNFVGMTNLRLQGRTPQQLTRGTDPPSSIKSYIVTVTDAFTSINGNVVPGQTVTTNVTFSFNVYYNDGGTGNQYQYLIAYATGLTDPGTPTNDSERTKGYYQRYAMVQMAPNPGGNGNELFLVQQAPISSAGSYQATISANLQYNGGQASYPWSLSLPANPQSIPGWGVDIDNFFANPANATGWEFFQESPYNVVDDNWHDGFTYVGGLVLDYYPKTMNPTSTTQFPVNVGSVWRTSTPFDNGIEIQYGVGAQFELLHAHERSPGIYDRDRTQQTLTPDSTVINLLFNRATSN
ncbi:MAG: hypothetical protein K1X67_13815 [Fimbriimonadaceae bacterium]|nr:hypothetical protein [Fimbriimonadaceae bacterium]